MPRVIAAFKQFLDDSGDPLVDGWLRFTASGSNNTDKDTFADVNESIPNTNPLQLSAAGRCPNVFGSGSYRVTSFVDAAGAPGQQIQQFDPIGGTFGIGDWDDWNDEATYTKGFIVTGSDGLYYRSLINENQSNIPPNDLFWERLDFTRLYNVNVTYAQFDLIRDAAGTEWISQVDSNIGNDQTSDDGSFWKTANTSQSLVPISSRTTNAVLEYADGNNLISITSGTFAQTFAAAAELGVGWWCYVENNGTGEITLTPNGIETINGAATESLLPGVSVLVTSDGSNLDTMVVNNRKMPINRIARTSNTIISLSNHENLIDITSGTFTQTFSASSTFFDGWWCYVQNSGSGLITLDPSGAETINGAASHLLYPSESVLVSSDGSNLNLIVSGDGPTRVTRVPRSSNTIITQSNHENLFDITSGTFTQTFAAAATLFDGWWCYYKNGTGTVTLDPSGAETINGNPTQILTPGQSVFIQSDGLNLTSIRIDRGFQGTALGTTLLGSVNPVAAATATFNDFFSNTDYDNFIVEVNMTCSATAILRAQFYLDDVLTVSAYRHGSMFHTSNLNAAWLPNHSSSSDTAADIVDMPIDTSSRPVTITFRVDSPRSPADTAGALGVIWDGTGPFPPGVRKITGAMSNNSTTALALTGMHFFPDSGLITGTIRIYGITKP